MAATLGLLMWAALAAAASAPAAHAASVSSNWAGYVAVPSVRVGSRFSSVSGSWRQPAASCSPGREAYSAIWVGLGGDDEAARHLEQIGTDVDCSGSGSASYASWYELLPAGPVNVGLHVSPGDQMSASVTVNGRDVTLGMRDLSTGARFTTTRRGLGVDASSAEWIVEAPSACVSNYTCQTLPLTDFGDVAFASATATARSRTGTIVDPAWSSTALELRQSAFTRSTGRAGPRARPTGSLIVATPTAASPFAGAFSVDWKEQLIQGEDPGTPTLPGFASGPA
jgi:Peptidase A4 family